MGIEAMPSPLSEISKDKKPRGNRKMRGKNVV